MFYHRNLAVHGLSPNDTTTRSVSNQGLFEVQTIITPVVLSGGGGGGGYVPSFSGKPDRYRITVRVNVNGVWSEESVIVDDNRARVIANIRGIKIFDDSAVMVSINNIQIFSPDIAVFMVDK